MNWAKLITCKMADLTCEGQPRGNETSGHDGLAGMVRLQKAFRRWLLEAYHNLPSVHELGPARKEPKLAGPAQWVKRKGIRPPRYGAVGRHGSIAVVERFILTMKQLLRLFPLITLRRESFRHELIVIAQWYNEHRPLMVCAHA